MFLSLNLSLGEMLIIWYIWRSQYRSCQRILEIVQFHYYSSQWYFLYHDTNPVSDRLAHNNWFHILMNLCDGLPFGLSRFPRFPLSLKLCISSDQIHPSWVVNHSWPLPNDAPNPCRWHRFPPTFIQRVPLASHLQTISMVNSDKNTP